MTRNIVHARTRGEPSRELHCARVSIKRIVSCGRSRQFLCLLSRGFSTKRSNAQGSKHPGVPWAGALLCRTKGVHDCDYGWALASMRPRSRRTMACIDRLNYRDIGVIKAPLCQDPSLEGVDKTRDWTPGIRISSPSSSHLPVCLLFYFLCSAWFERPLCHFLARLADALLISYYPHTVTRLRRIAAYSTLQAFSITLRTKNANIQAYLNRRASKIPMILIPKP